MPIWHFEENEWLSRLWRWRNPLRTLLFCSLVTALGSLSDTRLVMVHNEYLFLVGVLDKRHVPDLLVFHICIFQYHREASEKLWFIRLPKVYFDIEPPRLTLRVRTNITIICIYLICDHDKSFEIFPLRIIRACQVSDKNWIANRRWQVMDCFSTGSQWNQRISWEYDVWGRFLRPWHAKLKNKDNRRHMTQVDACHVVRKRNGLF